jgi:putative redox protein
MTSPELLLASLGSCAGFYAAQYLRKNRLAAEGTRVRVTCEKVKDPVARMTNFVIEVDAPVELTKSSARGSTRPWPTAWWTIPSCTLPKISLKVSGLVLAGKN